MRAITDNQRNTIKMIEQNLNIFFNGKTFEDAKQFISKNIEASKNARRKIFERMNFEETHNYNKRTNSWEFIESEMTEDEQWDDYNDRLCFDPNFN